MKISAILLIAILGLCTALPTKDSLHDYPPNVAIEQIATGINRHFKLGNDVYSKCVINGNVPYDHFLKAKEHLFKSSSDNQKAFQEISLGLDTMINTI